MFIRVVKALLAVAVIVTIAGMAGCGGGRGTNAGGGGNNTVGNNNCASAENCKTVEIGGVTWLKENLNIQTADSWCYDNSSDSCGKYGRLYTWEAAKSACELLGGGWHLPSRKEWDELVEYAGGSSSAGLKLKSTTGWHSNGNGTDEFGFSALPGGLGGSGGDFDDVGGGGYWWTASEYSNGFDDGGDGGHLWTASYSNGVAYCAMGNDYVSVVKDIIDDKEVGLSVRCVKD
jgi:uncharacterized protein (TIGR02145 family)